MNTLKIVSILLVAITLSSCASKINGVHEKLKMVSIIDRNGMSETFSTQERLNQYQATNFLKPQPYQKVLRIYERDNQGNIKAKVTGYHPNGQPKQYLEVVNSRAFGNYREWHANGNIKLKSFIIGGEADLNPASEKTWLFDGVAHVFNESGALIAKIMYDKGALQGESIYYHADGALWKKMPYCDNELNGNVEIYRTDGELLQKTTFVNGKKEGLSIRYWSKNRAAAFEHYENDFLLTGRYFDPSGKLISEIKEGNGFRAVFGRRHLTKLQEYSAGRQEGLIKIFDPDQALIRTYSLKNGLKHGVEVEYYAEPRDKQLPRLSVSWYEGKIQGIVKTWYDNGISESSREMSNNKKNGISTAWYRNGQIMLMEEYDNDKLLRGEYYKKGESSPISQVKEGKGLVMLFDDEGNFIRKIKYNEGIPNVED